MKKYLRIVIILIAICSLDGCSFLKEAFPYIADSANETFASMLSKWDEKKEDVFQLDNIPSFGSDAWVEINGNEPFFTEAEIKDAVNGYEYYPVLDSLGRCGACVAVLGPETMPTEERGEIGNVKPSGWHTVKYSGLIDGNYLYNRCHLIGYQLSGENANERNLITGTRYMNVEGMLPFENAVAYYIQSTGNHVLYRVTPIFKGTNLVASGVLMEGYSIEDDSIRFCVYCYNVQPGVTITYSNGESQLTYGDAATDKTDVINQYHTTDEQNATHAVNNKNGKIHIIGACPATGDGPDAMSNAEYFSSYKDAAAYSKKISGTENKCGNCY